MILVSITGITWQPGCRGGVGERNDCEQLLFYHTISFAFYVTTTTLYFHIDCICYWNAFRIKREQNPIFFTNQNTFDLFPLLFFLSRFLCFPPFPVPSLFVRSTRLARGVIKLRASRYDSMWHKIASGKRFGVFIKFCRAQNVFAKQIKNKQSLVAYLNIVIHSSVRENGSVSITMCGCTRYSAFDVTIFNNSLREKSERFDLLSIVRDDRSCISEEFFSL